jgi:hypothetical protein
MTGHDHLSDMSYIDKCPDIYACGPNGQYDIIFFCFSSYRLVNCVLLFSSIYKIHL